jgi:hypothetical protein
VFSAPPLTELAGPLALFSTPPLTELASWLAVLRTPPLIEANCAPLASQFRAGGSPLVPAWFLHPPLIDVYRSLARL